MKQSALIALIAALVAIPAATVAQTEAEMRRLAELDAVCEAARERKLAPLRAERTERCVREEKRPRELCQAENAHWGNTRAVRGGARAGLFYDLPECIAAFEARQQYRR